MERTVLRLCVFLLLLGTACSPGQGTPAPATNTPPVLPTSPLPPGPTRVKDTSTPPAEPILPNVEICSPLHGFSLQTLREGVVNPYQPPSPGSDNPHHGVDLAELQQPGAIALQGTRVDSVLEGTVASIFHDRFPYGTAILVETSLAAFPPERLAALSLPGAGPSWQPDPALTCPPVEVPDLDPTQPSIYTLYAHLASVMDLSVEERVGCGLPLGSVGNSGNALNPHLHLEMRTGPAGARLASMAHYDPSATTDEMAAYCLWRVSGTFRSFDPFNLLNWLAEEK